MSSNKVWGVMRSLDSGELVSLGVFSGSVSDIAFKLACEENDVLFFTPLNVVEIGALERQPTVKTVDVRRSTYYQVSENNSVFSDKDWIKNNSGDGVTNHPSDKNMLCVSIVK